MRVYPPMWLKTSVVQALTRASRTGTFDGRMTRFGASYMDDCTAFHAGTGSLLIFTRDVGHHTSGWFKNPDYERCLHLSISFREPLYIHQQAAYDSAMTQEWVELFFGDAKRYCWAESPKSPQGKQLEVMHWRVFCDALWQPILPRSEVYSVEFTEKGWHSFSELYPEDPRQEPSILHAG